MVTTAGPATLAGVKTRLKIAGDDLDDDLQSVVDAVNSIVVGLPVATPNPTDPAPWPARVVEGSTMLASRLYRRRLSPAGVEAFGADGPVYVQRNDPDIAMLLQLGSYAPPQVG